MNEQRNKASAGEINEAIALTVTVPFFKKLTAYTIKRFRFQFGILCDRKRTFKEKLVEDIVSDLILSFLDEGGRNWYKDKHPSFEGQLFSSLDSEISNFVKTKFKATIDLEYETEDFKGDFESLEYKQMYNQCMKALEDNGADIDELLVFECISKGLARRDIAAELNIPPESVTVIRKRLDRKISILRNQLQTLS